MRHLSCRLGVAATARGCSGNQIDIGQLRLARFAQQHHSGVRNAVALPVTDAGHAHIKQTRHLSGAAEHVNNLGCMRIHAPDVRSS